MGRLIDADELLSVVRHMTVVDKSVMHRILIQMPTVDAVPVTHCKDCKHHHYQNGIPYCDRYYWGWKDDDFCSAGERKDGYCHRAERERKNELER